MTEAVYQLINRPRRVKAQIRMKLTQIDDLRLMMLPSGIAYDKDAVQTCPSDPMLRYAEKLTELEAEVSQLKDQYLTELNALSSALDKLDNANEAEVLSLRYISETPFSDIAMSAHASESTVYRWHRKGLEKLNMIVNDS